ncbi:MAG TPA: NUDIX domain-containing protein [Patescibacteria group bacterium]|nr:NUDIX domain-containing protein [Patescibacteria group bacterium]
MRIAVRAIVIKDDQLLVMHRNKFGTEYDTLPGGNVEIGETHEQALFREIDEETTVTIADPHLVFLEHAGDPYGEQYIFLCRYVSGEPQLRNDSEEELIHRKGQNLYVPGWVKLSDLPSKPFKSEALRDRLLAAVQSTWPDTPVEF